MENKMKEVAKLLGVELEEEFRINGLSYKYKLTKDGLMCWSDNLQRWYISSRVGELLTGENQIIKLPKTILDDIEKKYLSAVIKPFIKKVTYIIKHKSFIGNYEYISIAYRDRESAGETVLNFPDFKAGTMYRGMKLDKLYTLKDLEI